MAETRDRVVLIIEDDPEIARLMQLMLAWVVTRVVVATDPRVGIETARGLRPDLILCDISMPGMNGFDLRRELAADPELAEIPFVFVSSHARVDSQLTGLRLGATAYLTKPIRRETLVATVLHQLERRQQAEEEAAAAATVVKPVADATSGGHLTGRLDTIAMPDLLQLLESSRSSGVLEVRDGASTGELTFAAGRLIAARTGVLSGEDAALRLLWLVQGDFLFRKQPVAPRDDGGGWSIARLLVDAAWLHDELARLGDSAPRVTDAVVIVDPAKVEEQFNGVGCAPWPSWEELAQTKEVTPVAALAATIGTSVHRCRAHLGIAYEQGAVRIVAGDGEDTVGPLGPIHPILGGIGGRFGPKRR